MKYKVYLSGEIHTDWREEIMQQTKVLNLEIEFHGPVTNHKKSDDCGVEIMGQESSKFWHDHKGAKLNAIRTKKGIDDADIVVIRFGDRYKQWNAAFDAGYAAAKNKSMIIMHGEETQHALKEIDSAASAVVQRPEQVVEIFKYLFTDE